MDLDEAIARVSREENLEDKAKRLVLNSICRSDEDINLMRSGMDEKTLRLFDFGRAIAEYAFKCGWESEMSFRAYAKVHRIDSVEQLVNRVVNIAFMPGGKPHNPYEGY